MRTRAFSMSCCKEGTIMCDGGLWQPVTRRAISGTMPRGPVLRLAPLLLVALTLSPTLARADEGDPEDGAVPRKAGGSRFTFAFTGGALIPRGEMEAGADGGLDIQSRFGWTASNGLGFVVNAQYAIFRRIDEQPGAAALDSDASLFAATAAPRLT